MEFEEMKKIWDAQNNQTLYAIDHEGLHRRIMAKKQGTKRTTNWIELLLIVVNMASGSFVIITHYMKNSQNYLGMAFGMAMVLVGFYILGLRIKRIKNDRQTDLSILGDLDNAIENINYRVKLSKSMLGYYIFVAGFSIYTIYERNGFGTSLILVTAFFVLGLFLSRWEHRKVHMGKKNQLVRMREKLVNELDID